MALQCGIVGLPNVGKSTLFNCLSNAKAQSANFPFCTILCFQIFAQPANEYKN